MGTWSLRVIDAEEPQDLYLADEVRDENAHDARACLDRIWAQGDPQTLTLKNLPF